MKLKKLFILLATIFIFGYTNVKADTVYDIDVNMYINKDGSAEVTETWDVKADNGTEWYHPFRDLGETKITEYTVTMDGQPLTYKNWNVDESLSEKAGYYGINYTATDTELCFGKSNYDQHTFVLKYHVENFIFNTDDPNIEFGLTSDKLSVQERNHLCVKLIMTLLPRNAAEAATRNMSDEGSEPKEKTSIIKKIGRKIIEKREARYYRDEEE